MVITGYKGTDAVLDIAGEHRIRAIEKKTFLCCRTLRSVSIPESIEELGDYCFSMCENLCTVSIGGAPRGDIFGKGVFEGCSSLTKIAFDEAGEGLSKLLAAAVNLMSAEHLLRADDIGDNFWYEKWDISLMSMLGSDDNYGVRSLAMGGEEDISYDGLPSVDGEMSVTDNSHMLSIAKKKCELCFLRLKYDDHLSRINRDKIVSYIRERAYGCKNDYAWRYIRDDCDDKTDYTDIYMSVVEPDRETILRMIEDPDTRKVQLKAMLIARARAGADAVSALDDMML